MANEEHLRILKQGVAVWNKWREDNPGEKPDLSEADFDLAPFSGVNFSRANLIEASLIRADLIEANLIRADLYGADLRGADLTKADLRWADLMGAQLGGAYLKEADFTYAALAAADLSYTVLRGTTFKRALLQGTNLTGAEVEGTSFHEAKVQYTILANLDLSSAIGLDTVEHSAPSTIGIDTLYRSKGAIPEAFLRGAGVPEIFIQYVPSLVEQPIQFYSVFISYSHKDKVFAKRLYDALQGRNIRCWLDEHQLLPGDKAHVGIDQGIRLWDKVLLCCSKDSLKSWWVNNEVELAIQKEQRLYRERGEEVLALIPLDLDGFLRHGDWNSGWKGQITGRIAPNFTGWQRSHKKFEAQLERVVKALRADAGARGVVPPRRL